MAISNQIGTMPRKGKKTPSKSGPPVPPAGAGNNSDDDESVFNDEVQSNISEDSSASFLKNEEGQSDDGDSFEEKLSDVLELASGKAAKDRTKALDNLRKAFSKKFIPWYLEDRRMTISDTIERGLKRGKVEEQIAAANLVGVFCAQIGSSDDSDVDSYNALRSILTPLMLDPTADPRTRGHVASALGIASFILGQVEEFGEPLEDFEKVFSGSYKGGTKHSAETLAMHTSALASWTLLMSMMSPMKCYKTLESRIANFLELLSSPDVDLRIAVGEAIVVLFENAIDNEGLEDEAFEVVAEAIVAMKELAKDSHKYRSKKDKKEQKSSFRDIIHYIDDNDEFYEKISFGRGESLEIDNWAQKKQFDALRKALGSGINVHLAQNPLLRDIFQLGAVVVEFDKEEMRNAKKQHIKHAKQSNMMKDMARGKNRDKKRAAMF